MNSPCRGDCNQGRNCYCGAEGDDQYRVERVVILVCVVVAVCVIVTAVAAARLS